MHIRSEFNIQALSVMGGGARKWARHCVILLILMTHVSFGGESMLIVGTSHDHQEQLIQLKCDDQTGKLTLDKILSSGFGHAIVTTGANQHIYSAGGNKQEGVIVSFREGQMTGRMGAMPLTPCYTTTDMTQRFLLTAHFHGKSITCVALDQDGSLKGLVQRLKLTPMGKNVHPHAVIASPDNKFLFAPDISGPRICRIRFNDSTGAMTQDGDITSDQFFGPRHLTFGPSGRHLYVLNQMGGAVTVFEYKSEDGSLKEIQHISALPKNFSGNNHSAAIVIHPNGRFLYCSNRGPNTITLFELDPTTGQLIHKKCYASGGDIPVSLLIASEGKYLLCANKKSNNIQVFEIEPKWGTLLPTEDKLSIAGPLSMDFFRP